MESIEKEFYRECVQAEFRRLTEEIREADKAQDSFEVNILLRQKDAVIRLTKAMKLQ